MAQKTRSGGISETQAGICEYLGQGVEASMEVTGTLKHRYTDFVVNEIGVDGEIVRLKDTALPKELVPEEIVPEAKPSKEPEFLLEGVKELSKFGEDESEMVKQMLAKANLLQVDDPIEEVPTHVVFPVIDDKAKRTNLHDTIRRYFTSILISDTKEKQIRVFLQSTSNGKKRSLKVDWRSAKNMAKRVKREKGSKTLLQFVIVKTNTDTHFITSKLTKALGSKFKTQQKSLVGLAGTKDKRGVTTQRMTLNRPYHINTIEQLQRALKHPNIQIGDFQEVKEELKLGDLSGNRFSVVIRALKLKPIDGAAEQATEPDPRDVLSAKLQSLETNGFINYFGLQRFGVRSSTPTYLFGRCLLTKNYSVFLYSLLGEDEDDSTEVAEAKAAVRAQVLLEEGRNSCVVQDKKMLVKAAKQMPHYLTAECAVLRSMCKQLDRGKGDEVDLAEAIRSIPYKLRSLYLHSVQSLVWNFAVSKRIQNGDVKGIAGDLYFNADGKTAAERVAPEGSESAGQYGDDYVMPLPGFDMIFSKNKYGKEFYKGVVEECLPGLELDTFLNSKLVAGGYRQCVHHANDVSMEMLKTHMGSDDLLRLEGTDTLTEEDVVAAKIEFSLGKSVYATMAIRELLRTPTDHATLAAVSKSSL